MIGSDIVQRALEWARGFPGQGDWMSTQELALAVAEELCEMFEGFSAHPYLDAVGVSTIGFGATYYMDGRKVSLKDKPISRETALRLLRWHCQHVYLPAVMRACPGVTSPYMLAALISFTFNLGEPNLRASTLRRKINDGAPFVQIRAQFMRWVYAGGKVLRGLVRRRAAEADTAERTR